MKSAAQKTAPGRTHLERRREAERRILSAALDIVAERGLDGLTLQEAGEAAGFSRALPAHYFGTREAMLAAVVEQVVSGYRERLASGYGRLEGLEALFAGLTFFVAEGRRAPQGLKAYYEVIDAAPRRPALAPTVARLQTETLERTVFHLEFAMAAGDVSRDLDPHLEAVLFLASVRGLMTLWLGAPETFDLEAAREALIARLRRSWRPG